MKSIQWLGLLTLVTCFFFIGCGGNETGTVAEPGGVADFVADNPEMMDDTLEPEEETVDAE